VKYLLSFLLFIHIIGCGKEVAPLEEISKKQSAITSTYLSNQNSTFKLTVFYEEGAVPYTGNLGLSTNETWDITKSSFTTLLSQNNTRVIDIPTDLNQMTKFNSHNKTTWSYEELKNLGQNLSPNLKSDNSVNITVIFLNGYFENNQNTLGIHLTGYPFSFIFKDAITQVGGNDTTQKYIEQTTVVHEMGHTIGLVNSGIPMFKDHEDKNHLHHTTNSNGVMYWAVENSNQILSFLTDIIATNKLNLFEKESMDDVKNY
jgi:hypothetical protein